MSDLLTIAINMKRIEIYDFRVEDVYAYTT